MLPDNDTDSFSSDCCRYQDPGLFCFGFFFYGLLRVCVCQQQIKEVVTLIEIVIAWGVTPSLSPGLQVPLNLRLKNVRSSSPLASLFNDTVAGT